MVTTLLHRTLVYVTHVTKNSVLNSPTPIMKNIIVISPVSKVSLLALVLLSNTEEQTPHPRG
jgi:hypothetical protein